MSIDPSVSYVDVYPPGLTAFDPAPQTPEFVQAFRAFSGCSHDVPSIHRCDYAVRDAGNADWRRTHSVWSGRCTSCGETITFNVSQVPDAPQ